jgi:hypothetical protein
VALLLAQLRDIAAKVEQHGIEIGMLMAALLDLIERHEAASTEGLLEQPASEAPAAATSSESLLSQLAADHRTMLSFNGPLVVLQQFYDRLRQRLEHMERALLLLPCAETLSPETLALAPELFPLSEERSALAEDSGAAADSDQAPPIEFFT